MLGPQASRLQLRFRRCRSLQAGRLRSQENGIITLRC